MLPATRKYRYVTLGLAGLTAASWTAVILIDCANLPGHVWHVLVNIATVCTNAMLFSVVLSQLGAVNERLDRAYRAMAQMHAGRPDPSMTPPPWQGLRVAGDPARQNGHHASRPASGA